ncbi:MAG: PEGA domain-containing protein [Polyangiaceae bacterium]
MLTSSPLSPLKNARSSRVLSVATLLLCIGRGTPAVAQTQTPKATSTTEVSSPRKPDTAGTGTESFPGEKQWNLFFQEARAAYGGGQFVKARSLYLKALAIKSTPRILANLAQVEVRLEAYKSAANHAAASLEELGSDKGVEAELAKAKKHVAAIVITSNVEGASVTVDGESFGTTPLRMPVYVESGERKVVLSKAGYATAERNLSLEKGTERRVEMPLTPDTAPATTPVAAGQASTAEPTKAGATKATPAAPFEEPKREPAKANPAVLIAGGVVAVGGLVAGLVFNAKANSKYDDAEAKSKESGVSGCYGAAAHSPECKAQMGELEDGDCARNWSTASFVVGGAALVGTAVYWFWPRSGSKPSPDGGLELKAAVLPGNTWVGIASQF